MVVAVRTSRLTLASHLPGWLMFALAIVAMATQKNAYVILLLLVAATFLDAVAERNNPNDAHYLKRMQPLGCVSLGV